MTFEEWYAAYRVSIGRDAERDLEAAWLASRTAALEEAAKVCDALEMPADSPMDDLSYESATYDCRDAILALGRKTKGKSAD